MMRFMIIVKATRDSEAGVMPEEKLIAADLSAMVAESERRRSTTKGG